MPDKNEMIIDKKVIDKGYYRDPANIKKTDVVEREIHKSTGITTKIIERKTYKNGVIKNKIKGMKKKKI